MKTNTFESRASWVVEHVLANGTRVEVSEKGAIAINGDRYHWQKYENLVGVASDELRAFLDSAQCAPYFARQKSMLRKTQERLDLIQKFRDLGLSMDAAEAAARAALK